MDQILKIVADPVFLVGLFAASVRMATPILLAALGEILAERSGVLNIGIEGIMLTGAFVAFLGAHASGDMGLGLAAAVAAGAVLGAVMAFMSIAARANQVVTGIALNIFGLGVTAFVYRLIFGTAMIPPSVTQFETIEIPYLSAIPYLGPILFQQIGLVYATGALVPILWLVLYRTPFGLNIRAVGEMPRAADTVGVAVFRMRYICVILGGILAAVGGAVLSLGQMGFFSENMTAGRGFIAIAIVIFANWDPVGALGAALLFGFADALQLRLQAMGAQIPFQFLLMLPYLLTIVVLVGVVGKAEAPAALTVPYVKEEE